MELSDRYNYAKMRYAEVGVDIDEALKSLSEFSLSLHCWQADDVGGFETPDAALGGGGIQTTGNYPGKARTLEELRGDIGFALKLIPGNHRLNLHASYGDFAGQKVERDKIEPKHYESWVKWAKEQNLKLDFNCTMFSHPKADDGFTLSSKDKAIRDFWIAHTEKAREIAAYFGRQQGCPSVHNLWIPDGTKDYPADRFGYRKILVESLDQIFKTEYPEKELKDAVESKLFGIGSEAFVVGSNDFYLSYAISRNKMICFDMGHFHPTELVADKVSAFLQFQNSLLLHVSRPMRWDSDHIVLFNDDLNFMAQEVVRSGKDKDVYVGLDFFDASVNRIGAYAVGSRSALKAWLAAYLEPTEDLIKLEEAGDNIGRMALSERMKSMPLGEVWDHFCEMNNTPTEAEYMKEVYSYEKDVLSRRN
ncbi:MAG: L-rhamnose isomerase [Spirochaetales bacterium]|nr:L-rhamnose isomerase [Spirochaetales bacterium]